MIFGMDGGMGNPWESEIRVLKGRGRGMGLDLETPVLMDNW